MKLFGWLVSLGALVCVVVAARGETENWPGWRGPRGNGVVPERHGPAELSRERSWQVPLGGRACSTPVVWDGKVFVTGLLEERDSVQSFDLKTGKELWRRTLSDAVQGRTQRIGSSANSSPLTDGKNLFVYFKSGTVASLTMNGQVEWQIDLEDSFFPDKILWDKGTSPVFAGGNLVIAVMQQEGTSYLVSLDKRTGKKVWLAERPFDTEGECGDSYASPFVATVDGVETIVTWGADHLTGHDAATGEQLWFCGGFNPDRHKVYRTIASAAGTNGIAVVPFGREEFVAGIRLGGSGDITDGAWLWKHRGWGSDTCTPAADNGRTLVLTDRGKERGTLTYLEAESGTVLWREKLPRSVHTYCASPTIAGKTAYLARQDGVVFAADLLEDGIDNLRELNLEDGIIASPVVVEGKLLIRSDQFLTCLW